MTHSRSAFLIRLLPATYALLAAVPFASSATAADYCTDIPDCPDGKVLVFVDEEKREDCAMFACSSPALADSVGRRVTPEILARFKEEPKIRCEDGKTAVKLKETPEGRENAWVCAAPMLLRYYTANDMLAGDTLPDDTISPISCENNRMLVRYKTKPKNAETAWACIDRRFYKVLSNKGLLVEE